MANINLKKNEGAKSAEQLIQELNDIKDLWQEDQDSRTHKYAAADAAADIRKAVKGTAIEAEANRILNGDGAFLESVKRIIALLNKSEDNADTHLVDLGLDSKFKDMIDSVFGQMSDGYWENTPRMRGYWKFADPILKDNKIYLEIDNTSGEPYGNGVIRNLWDGMSDARVKQFLADKIKFLVKEEGLKWDRGNTNTTDYLSYSNPYPVKDCYYAYEVLKGRNVGKHPEYSEAYVGIKDGNEFPVNVEYIDVDDDWQGNSSPDIYKVTVNGESGETDAIDDEKECVGKVLKALGYSLKEKKAEGLPFGKRFTEAARHTFEQALVDMLNKAYGDSKNVKINSAPVSGGTMYIVGDSWNEVDFLVLKDETGKDMNYPALTIYINGEETKKHHGKNGMTLKTYYGLHDADPDMLRTCQQILQKYIDGVNLDLPWIHFEESNNEENAKKSGGLPFGKRFTDAAGHTFELSDWRIKDDDLGYFCGYDKGGKPIFDQDISKAVVFAFDQENYPNDEVSKELDKLWKMGYTHTRKLQKATRVESEKSEAAGRLTSWFRLKDIPEEQADGYFHLFDDHFQMAECEYDWSDNSRGDDLIITVYDERVRPEDLKWLGRKFEEELKDFSINIGG